jgi:hypothetical protein
MAYAEGQIDLGSGVQPFEIEAFPLRGSSKLPYRPVITFLYPQ